MCIFAPQNWTFEKFEYMKTSAWTMAKGKYTFSLPLNTFNYPLTNGTRN